MAVYLSGKAPSLSRNYRRPRQDREAELAFWEEADVALSFSRLRAMVALARKTAKRLNTPEPGALFLEDGQPFANLQTYAESMADEFRELLFVRLGLVEPGADRVCSELADVLAVARPFAPPKKGGPPTH